MKKGLTLVEIIVIISILAILVAIAVPAIIEIKEMMQYPTVTDKRFSAGYTEVIQERNSSDREYITYPAKYELQLDGEKWVEVTEQEYADVHIDQHYRR